MTETETETDSEQTTTATRSSLQWPRRFFHMSMGLSIGFVYHLLLTHAQMIHILGLAACMIYILEQIRLAYPKIAQSLAPVMKNFFRAEEQLKESAGVPYVMGLLLTIISFPKTVALAGIYILAVADPLSAIVGIKFGKHKITKNKSLEGSGAFFISSFLAIYFVFASFAGHSGLIFVFALISSIMIAAFELIPIKVDDNLTIPLFSGILIWILSAFFEISFL